MKSIISGLFWISALVIAASMPLAHAQTPSAPITLVGAGSLTGAMTAVINDYHKQTGQVIQARFGPSGLLREDIEAGLEVDIFASANMDHPQRLADAGWATPPVIMVRNRLCARALPGLELRSDNLLERMLDPAIGIGTSTPLADPGGDYAWMMFSRAEQVHPGAETILQQKAQQVVGGRTAVQVPAGKTVTEYFLEQGRIHMSIGYCSRRTRTPDPALVSVAMPPELAVHANYGVSVLLYNNRPREDVWRFVLYLLSPQAQQIMAQYGFIPVSAP